MVVDCPGRRSGDTRAWSFAIRCWSLLFDLLVGTSRNSHIIFERCRVASSEKISNAGCMDLTMDEEQRREYQVRTRPMGMHQRLCVWCGTPVFPLVLLWLLSKHYSLTCHKSEVWRPPSGAHAGEVGCAEP